MSRPIDPADLAHHTAGLPAPVLIGLDVDGVLAPIVERADEARLTPGVADALAILGQRVHLAVVSGRSLADLDRLFGLPACISVIGSHGLEERGRPPLSLDPHEQVRLDRLVALAEKAADLSGDGSWVEHKPASVVLHVRQADERSGAEAVAFLTAAAPEVDGAHVKLGHSVVEVMARHTSKATAIATLRERTGARAVVFAGDDRTDEEVFATLGAGDVTVRVGPGETLARFRLDDPDAVMAWLDQLVADLGDAPTPTANRES